ncbi:hypothetical protein U9M48_034147 [Paspalum notatum var. saurae]|uniref:Uncharacterized protein n=1 Tax=Paspalum notatum var. saurae TaxID=547442 RepID=A0AAQ3X8M2_PASNO
MTARRWSRAALLACLLLLAAACAAEARPAPADDGRRSGAFDAVLAGLASIGLARRWRPGGAGLVDDDRRRVPTGPNPLHNR